MNIKRVRMKPVPSIYQRLKRRYEERMGLLNKKPNLAERLAVFKKQKRQNTKK